jgi:hypothetical protein
MEVSTMVRATTTLALATAALLTTGGATAAPQNIELGGMDCAEKATQLRDVIERNEVHENEADRLQTDVTRALTNCRNGDAEAFAELATRLETREWQAEVEPMDG